MEGSKVSCINNVGCRPDTGTPHQLIFNDLPVIFLLI